MTLHMWYMLCSACNFFRNTKHWTHRSQKIFRRSAVRVQASIGGQYPVQDQHHALEIGAAVLRDVAEDDLLAVVVEEVLEEVVHFLHVGGEGGRDLVTSAEVCHLAPLKLH